MNLARCCFVLCLLAACAAGRYTPNESGHAAFVVPHHIAEGKGEGQDLPPDGGAPAPNAASSPSAAAGGGAPASSAARAASGASSSAPPLSGSAPDPEPLLMAEQWQYQLLFQNGAPSVESVDKQTLPKPVSTPRRMGRFALELWIGRELIDRVRFDFPLIAAEERPGITRRPLHDPPSLAPRAIARIRVSVPNSPRATRLLLVDRATQKSQPLPWPPDRTDPVVAPAPSASPAPNVPVPVPVPVHEKTHSGT